MKTLENTSTIELQSLARFYRSEPGTLSELERDAILRAIAQELRDREIQWRSDFASFTEAEWLRAQLTIAKQSIAQAEIDTFKSEIASA